MKIKSPFYFLIIAFLFVGIQFSCHPTKKIAATSTSFAKTNWSDTLHLQSGDIIFQDLDCGDLCDAIEKVTTSYGGYHFSHVGIVYKNEQNQCFVIEAYGEVQITPIQKFLNRVHDVNGKPKVIVGRLKDDYHMFIPLAVTEALSLKGTPYDDAFIINNGSYYCSELVYDCFKVANNNEPFFALAPMTFKDPATHQYMQTWIDYYKKLQLDIPENEPGINPGLISRSDKINILPIFGFQN